MAKEQKQEEQKSKGIDVKVVSLGDYMTKARELFGNDLVWENAAKLLYKENNVIAILDKKGEQRFIVEA